MGHCSLFKNLSVQGLNLELVAGADCRAFKALEMQGIASRNVFAECSISLCSVTKIHSNVLVFYLSSAADFDSSPNLQVPGLLSIPRDTLTFPPPNRLRK